eukprot:TRINITY_DN3160_c0_g1_i9.p1 TRINITY_DN3160_c0_g1~~TRINITY_DN3160_c0_g1_i9.p1  ORF type:complete len:241 (+),score=51.25 TRINITY_DN3160_c0_g1_i9:190-912(+)
MHSLNNICFRGPSTYGYEQKALTKGNVLHLMQTWKAELGSSNSEKISKVKKAQIHVTHRERLNFPTYRNSLGVPQPIGHYLCHPSASKSVLSINSLEDVEFLGFNRYRCTLRKLEFFKIEVVPVLDLELTFMPQECLVEMLSCKILGSKFSEDPNKRFSATAKNHITWNTMHDEQFVDMDVELNITLELYTLPFSALPVSVVERPGNMLMQALLSRLVPISLEQLHKDYCEWVKNEETNC